MFALGAEWQTAVIQTLNNENNLHSVFSNRKNSPARYLCLRCSQSHQLTLKGRQKSLFFARILQNESWFLAAEQVWFPLCYSLLSPVHNGQWPLHFYSVTLDSQVTWPGNLQLLDRCGGKMAQGCFITRSKMSEKAAKGGRWGGAGNHMRRTGNWHGQENNISMLMT